MTTSEKAKLADFFNSIDIYVSGIESVSLGVIVQSFHSNLLTQQVKEVLQIEKIGYNLLAIKSIENKISFHVMKELDEEDG